MIALLRGTLLEKHPNQAIVEAAGVGYDVTIPVSTFTHLPDAGAEVRLRIHTHVREDALSLYGFLTQDEKALFEKLISVSGIGPKLAVTILSGLAAPDLILPSGAARWSGWCASRASARRPPSAWCWSCATSCPRPPAKKPGRPPAAALSPIDQDVLSALLNLGCARPQAEAAVRKAKAGGARRWSSNRSSGARSNWYGKLVAHARPATDFRRRAGRRRCSSKPDCARAAWPISPGRASSRRTSPSPSKPPACAARPWTTCCSTGRPAWARPRSPPSSPRNWRCSSPPPPARCCRRSSTSPASSATSGAPGLLHRRDPPAAAGRGGDALLGAGGFPRGHPGGRRAGRAHALAAHAAASPPSAPPRGRAW